MRVVVIVVVALSVIAAAAMANPPAGSREVRWPQGEPWQPQVSVKHRIPGSNLDQLLPHPAPVAPAELQLLRTGWKFDRWQEQPIGARRIYQICSQSEAKSRLFSGMFAERPVYHRTVWFTNRNPGKMPKLEGVRKSWSVELTGQQTIMIDYYWADVPVLVDIHEYLVEEVYQRIGCVDP